MYTAKPKLTRTVQDAVDTASKRLAFINAELVFLRQVEGRNRQEKITEADYETLSDLLYIDNAPVRRINAIVR